MQVRHFRDGDGPRLVADCGGPLAGPLVVLLHSTGECRHVWGPEARAIASAGRQVVSIDLRGHGESDQAPDGDYRLESANDSALTIVYLPLGERQTLSQEAE